MPTLAYNLLSVAKATEAGKTITFGETQGEVIDGRNVVAVASIAKNPQFHGSSKHINIKFHFIREQVNNDMIRLEYCSTEAMLADLLTKGIGPEKFERLRNLFGLHVQPCVE